MMPETSPPESSESRWTAVLESLRSDFRVLCKDLNFIKDQIVDMKLKLDTLADDMAILKNDLVTLNGRRSVIKARV